MFVQKVARALKPWDAHLLKLMETEVHSVAFEKRPAVMAFFTSILRWPDELQPRSYVQGFSLREPDQSGVFRAIPEDREAVEEKRRQMEQEKADHRQKGHAAACGRLYERLRRGTGKEEIFQLTKKDLDKGWAEGFFHRGATG